jgi:uncharacterized protein YjiS (DUF1127 family)
MTRSATRRSLPRFAEEPIGSPTPDEARASANPRDPVGILAGGLQRFPRSYIDAIYRGWSERPRAGTIAVMPGPAKPREETRLQGVQPGVSERRPGALRRAWQAWLDRIHRWWLYKETVAELSALSDRELADLNILRFQIPMVAKHGASTPAKAARRLPPR